MKDTILFKTLWFAPFVGAMTACRIGADCGREWGEHGSLLVELGMKSWSDAGAAETLQHELLELARRSSSCASGKISDGIDELERLAAEK
jgi:hypothetical protein